MDRLIKEISKSKINYRKAIENSDDGFILYGAGFIGEWSIKYLKNLKFTLNGFIDSDINKWGKFLNGLKIYSPSEIKKFKSKVIIITSRHAVTEIKEGLSFLGKILISIDEFVVNQIGIETIQRVDSLFNHDRKSSSTFQSIIHSMITGSTNELSSVANNYPYFNEFGFFNKLNEIYVDAGAYVGDTLERFVWSVNGVFKHIHAFEPGLKQFKSLNFRVNRLIKEWALRKSQFSLINKILSSNNGTSYISADDVLTQTKVQNIHIKSEKKISKISLDNYFDGEKFTFLKVDVEGSEKELINGAINSIQNFRPKIALSIYHYPTDIFLLPLLCAKINSDYKFRIRHHSSQLIESVLYCKDKND